MELQQTNGGDRGITNGFYRKPNISSHNHKGIVVGDLYESFQSKDPIVAPNSTVAPEDADGKGQSPHIKYKPTSYMETMTHLFKGNVGSGMFAMGDAYKNAGMILAPIMTLLLGIVCVHAQHLLLNCAKEMREKTNTGEARDYADTVHVCFQTGPEKYRKYAATMRRFVNISLCVTQLGFCCVYFVFVSTNVKQVCDFYGYKLDIHYHMAIILLPILLSTMIRNLKYLAPFSTIANIFMIVGYVIVVYYASKDLPPKDIDSRVFIASWQQLPLFFGTVIYAFEGISLVLPLQNEMRRPEDFNRPLGVMNTGMFVVTVMLILIGTLGYVQYGDNVQGSLTLNLTEDILGQSVKIIISCGILLSYALQFYVPIDIMWPSIQAQYGPFKSPLVGELLFRTALVLVTFTLAEAIPHLGLFISLVGAVSSTALALIFPPILELVTKVLPISKSSSKWLLFKNGGIIIVGFIGFTTGTYESIRAIAHAFSKN